MKCSRRQTNLQRLCKGTPSPYVNEFLLSPLFNISRLNIFTRNCLFWLLWPQLLLWVNWWKVYYRQRVWKGLSSGTKVGLHSIYSGFIAQLSFQERVTLQYNNCFIYLMLSYNRERTQSWLKIKMHFIQYNSKVMLCKWNGLFHFSHRSLLSGFFSHADILKCQIFSANLNVKD